MDDPQKDSPDLSSRLDEAELLKPGTEIAPGESPSETPENSPGRSANLDQDVVEFNEFLTKQEEAATPQQEKPVKGFLHVVWEIIKTLLIAGVVVVIINTFIFQAYYVSGDSMNPDYHDGDYLLINKIPTSIRNITGLFGKKPNMDLRRGDVLVFKPPENNEIFYIKRVIGLPGDKVTLKDGKFTIYNSQYPNGLRLDETYIDPNIKTEGDIDQVVLPGNVFVVGDNRLPNASYDSRAWGQLPESNISGTAFFRLLPINDIGPIKATSYSPANN